MNNENLNEEITQEEISEVEWLNTEFVEFLHTKGFKAKVKLAIENIKKSTKENKVNINHKNDINEKILNQELELFLKNKNLNNKYTVEIKK